MNNAEKSRYIKDTAAELGFDACGIAQAMQLQEDARRLEQWLNNDMHGKMHYMQNHFELRIDPTQLVPGAKSVITLLLNYFPAKKNQPATEGIAKYAWGEDYHDVIKDKLRNFFFLLREKLGDINGRGFVDSAPVLEKSWAQKSGLGWIGKNGNLISKGKGSFYFIATLITDIVLLYDVAPGTDHCGSCTKCIDHCPTDAILPGKVVDGSKCISYFTIELKDALIPAEMNGRFNNWFFGCDVCQDVCPWNRFSVSTKEPRFEPIPAVLNFTEEDWEELTEEKFKIAFADSPIKRSKFSGIKRNLRFIKQAGNE